MTPRDAATGAAAASGTPPRAALTRALTEHLPYKAAALFFSFTLWLVVASAEPAERTVPVRIEPRLDAGIVLAGTPPVVRAVVAGRARDLVALGEGTLVMRRALPADAAAAAAAVGDSLRIELRPTDIDLPSRSGAVVRDVQPRVVTLRLARIGAVEAARVGDGRVR